MHCTERETMSTQAQAIPFVKSIFHPSDFSEASELAFAHALAIALLRKTQLVIMQVRAAANRKIGPSSPRSARRSHVGR